MTLIVPATMLMMIAEMEIAEMEVAIVHLLEAAEPSQVS
jgi:hypothetical protein